MEIRDFTDFLFDRPSDCGVEELLLEEEQRQRDKRGTAAKRQRDKGGRAGARRQHFLQHARKALQGPRKAKDLRDQFHPCSANRREQFC